MIRLSVIYMASGFGKRFGSNKLLEEIQGKKLYLYGLERLIEWQEIEAQKEAREETIENEETGTKKNQKTGKPHLEIKIILVSQYKEILETGKKMGLVCIENRQAQEGITASIRLGLAAADEADYYMFFVADQPWLRRETLEQFAWGFFDVSSEEIFNYILSNIYERASFGDGVKLCPKRYSIACLSTKKGRGGNPVIFHRRYRSELLALRGDKGGSQVIKRYPEEIFWYLAEEEEMKDIDRPSDIRERE